MTSTTKPKFKPSAGQQLFWKDFLMVYTVPVTLYQWPCTNVNKTDCYPHGAYHLQNPERIFMKDCLKDTRCLRPSNYSQIFSLPACGCWDALPSRLGRACAYAVEPQRLWLRRAARQHGGRWASTGARRRPCSFCYRSWHGTSEEKFPSDLSFRNCAPLKTKFAWFQTVRTETGWASCRHHLLGGSQ